MPLRIPIVSKESESCDKSGKGDENRNNLKSPLERLHSPFSKDMTPEAVALRNARGFLNKLTQDNFSSISAKWSALTIPSKETMKKLAKAVVEKAILEQQYSEFYAILCLQFDQNCPNFGPGTFRSSLLDVCKDKFRNISPGPVSCCEESTHGSSSFDSLPTIPMHKKNAIGLVRFVAYLYLQEMFGDEVIQYVAHQLILCSQRPEENNIEYFCVLLRRIGATLDSTPAGGELMRTFVARLKEISTMEYSSRTNFMISDLLELRSNNWVDRRGGTTPVSRLNPVAEKETKSPEKLDGRGRRAQFVRVRVGTMELSTKVTDIVDYYIDDKDKACALRDWRAPNLQDNDLTLALGKMLRIGYENARRAVAVVELLEHFVHDMTLTALEEALQATRPYLLDARLCNPRVEEFVDQIRELCNTLDFLNDKCEVITRDKKGKRRSIPSQSS